MEAVGKTGWWRCGIRAEVGYHPSSLTELYNKERACLATNMSEKDLDPHIHVLPLSELLTYIVETNTGSDGPTVFVLLIWSPLQAATSAA